MSVERQLANPSKSGLVKAWRGVWPGHQGNQEKTGGRQADLILMSSEKSHSELSHFLLDRLERFSYR